MPYVNIIKAVARAFVLFFQGLFFLLLNEHTHLWISLPLVWRFNNNLKTHSDISHELFHLFLVLTVPSLERFFLLSIAVHLHTVMLSSPTSLVEHVLSQPYFFSWCGSVTIQYVIEQNTSDLGSWTIRTFTIKSYTYRYCLITVVSEMLLSVNTVQSKWILQMMNLQCECYTWYQYSFENEFNRWIWNAFEFMLTETVKHQRFPRFSKTS